MRHRPAALNAHQRDRTYPDKGEVDVPVPQVLANVDEGILGLMLLQLDPGLLLWAGSSSVIHKL